MRERYKVISSSGCDVSRKIERTQVEDDSGRQVEDSSGYRIGRRLVLGKVKRKIDSGNVIGVSDRRKVLVNAERY